MLLRENHISVFQANWLDKPSNLEAKAKTLNIGLDALVFLDDNPAERAQVRAALPISFKSRLIFATGPAKNLQGQRRARRRVTATYLS
jgi:predicted enzyme involved in methoxymalonyl-ACP biosynthesis